MQTTTLFDRIKPWLIVFAFSFSISTAIIYSNINLLSEDNIGGLTDSFKYVDAYYGQEITGHWRYRILTIELAQAVPDVVEHLSQREMTDYRSAHLHFAVVNLFFLTATGILMYDYTRKLGFSPYLALLGMVMFLTSHTNIQGAGAPMTDPSAFFFLLLGMWAIIQRNPLVLFIAILLGVFAKETTLFLWVFVWLSDLKPKEKIIYSLILLPATIAYMVFRYIISPDPVGASYFNIELAKGWLNQLKTFTRPNGLIDWFSSFFLYSLLAAYTLFAYPIPPLLKRWLWFVPLIIGMIIFLGGNLGRVLFMTFPVVIPLALICVEQWLHDDDVPAKSSLPTA